MKDLTPDAYQQLVSERSPKSPLAKDMVWAFLVGGAICTLGQWIQSLWQGAGLDQQSGATATSMTLIALAALFTGFGLYDKLAKHAGAGTIVPITGFSNAITAPAMEFRSEGFVLGMAAKMFVIAGPVIVYGTAASVVYGLVLYIMEQL